MMDLIIAPATPLQPALRGVLRVSGAGCRQLALEQGCWQGRGRVRQGRLDRGIEGLPLTAYHFAAGRSYTGEEMVEWHVPGHPWVMTRLLEHWIELGARRADPGEFTRRAFESGRLGLHEAQAVLDIINATDRAAQTRALEVLSGRRREAWELFHLRVREALLAIENELDFDEGDEGLLAAPWYDALWEDLTNRWRELVQGAERERLPRVMLWGPVNAGKSTLFNFLGGKALTSSRAGTTRDWLEVPCETKGVSFLLIDTPGYDGPGEGVDAQALELALRERQRADLVVRLNRLGAGDPEADWQTCADEIPKPWPSNALSVHSGEGVAALATWIAGRLQQRSLPVWLDEEHRSRCEAALAALTEDHHGTTAADPVLWSSHLRELKRLLDPLGTRLHPDEILNDLFSRFCIGK